MKNKMLLIIVSMQSCLLMALPVEGERLDIKDPAHQEERPLRTNPFRREPKPADPKGSDNTSLGTPKAPPVSGGAGKNPDGTGILNSTLEQDGQRLLGDQDNNNELDVLPEDNFRVKSVEPIEPGTESPDFENLSLKDQEVMTETVKPLDAKEMADRLGCTLEEAEEFIRKQAAQGQNVVGAVKVEKPMADYISGLVKALKASGVDSKTWKITANKKQVNKAVDSILRSNPLFEKLSFEAQGKIITLARKDTLRYLKDNTLDDITTFWTKIDNTLKSIPPNDLKHIILTRDKNGNIQWKVVKYSYLKQGLKVLVVVGAFAADAAILFATKGGAIPAIIGLLGAGKLASGALEKVVGKTAADFLGDEVNKLVNDTGDKLNDYAKDQLPNFSLGLIAFKYMFPESASKVGSTIAGWLGKKVPTDSKDDVQGTDTSDNPPSDDTTTTPTKPKKSKKPIKPTKPKTSIFNRGTKNRTISTSSVVPQGNSSIAETSLGSNLIVPQQAATSASDDLPVNDPVNNQYNLNLDVE